ncbi:MAG: undecaprenyl-diphosphatase UppP [Myxococcales bacterium]|nr:undecaprenyl-diphosphatase UppP [Myxococcales bacterium]
MELWFAALLGVVQGLTEFLPVSSTAHLTIVPALLGVRDPGAAYTAVIQLGTLVAVVWYLRTDLARMTTGLAREPRGPDARLALLVALGTAPIGIAGLALEPLVDGALRSLWVIVGTLAGVGVLMWLIDRRASLRRDLDSLRPSDALLIGCAQALALVPGVSRSGATILCALWLGLRRDAAARLSFLLSIPAIAAAGVFKLPDAVRALGPEAAPALLVGALVAALTGYAAIAWLMHHLRARSLGGFAAYRVLVALLLAALLASGVVRAA